MRVGFLAVNAERITPIEESGRQRRGKFGGFGIPDRRRGIFYCHVVPEVGRDPRVMHDPDSGGWHSG